MLNIRSRPSQLSSSLRRQVWSAVKRLDSISPKLLIMFDPHLGWCNSEIFKVATNIFYPTQDRTRYLLASEAMLLPTELHQILHIARYDGAPLLIPEYRYPNASRKSSKFKDDIWRLGKVVTGYEVWFDRQQSVW